jgi:3-oxoisoapionate-4-phosphate decarboxylase
VALRPLPAAATPSYPTTDSGPFHRAEADIAFPFAAIGTDLSALMTIAIGGVYAIKGFTGLRIIDMKLPGAFGKAWPGPQFGVAGSRQLTGVAGRPLIGTIIKPALGLRPDESAALVKEVIDADVDFVKDDEKLMSPDYSPLAERVKAIMPLIHAREQKTGKKVMYAWGISATDPDDMMRNHDTVLKAGGNCAVININSIGFGAMAFLRKRSGLVLHAHRNGWDVLTRHPGLGLDFKVWQQFWRMLGVDQFQINGIRVKYWEPDESFVDSFKAIRAPLFSPDDCPLPVAGSGQWGGQAHDTYERTGRTVDLMYLCGGGIVSHPGGAGAGVRAVKQAWEAAVAGIDLAVYAKDHPELAQSIATFADGRGA